MTLVLAVDIGGTKTLLRLIEIEANGQLSTIYEETYPSQSFTDLVPIVNQFQANVKIKTGKLNYPASACFGVAGAVFKQTSHLPNLGWYLESVRLEKELEIPQVVLINDFAAVGYGVCKLQPSDIYTLQVGQPEPQTPIAVMGAGTGL